MYSLRSTAWPNGRPDEEEDSGAHQREEKDASHSYTFALVGCPNTMNTKLPTLNMATASCSQTRPPRSPTDAVAGRCGRGQSYFPPIPVRRREREELPAPAPPLSSSSAPNLSSVSDTPEHPFFTKVTVTATLLQSVSNTASAHGNAKNVASSSSQRQVDEVAKKPKQQAENASAKPIGTECPRQCGLPLRRIFVVTNVTEAKCFHCKQIIPTETANLRCYDCNVRVCCTCASTALDEEGDPSQDEATFGA